MKVGDKHGRLTVIDLLDGKKVKARCDCRKIVTVVPANLRSGNTKSCGCYRREMIRKNKPNWGPLSKASGL